MKIKRLLSGLLTVAVIATCSALPTYADDGILLTEGFEGTVSERWNGNNLKVSEDIVHSGEQSLVVSKYGTNNDAYKKITYNDLSEDVLGNYVYEFWLYDDGTPSHAAVFGWVMDGKRVLTGIKNDTAYNDTYWCEPGGSTGVARTVGWHRFVVDLTTPNKVTLYIDGESTNIVNKTPPSKSESNRIAFENNWTQGGDWMVMFDDFKIYESLDYVPMHDDDAISSIKFASGTDADGAEKVTLADGDITMNFTEEMADVSASNFVVRSRDASSVSDADYTDVSDFDVTSSGTGAVISIANIEDDKTYRIEHNNIKTSGGKTVAGDFFTFSTATDVSGGAVLPLFWESFEDENISRKWISTAGTDPVIYSTPLFTDERSHSGAISLGIKSFEYGVSSDDADAASKKEANKVVRYAGEYTDFGNYAYEFWLYDDMKSSTGFFSLDGIDGETYYAGVKHTATELGNNYYLYNVASSTGIERSPGWHQFILDLTTDGKISMYIDGKITECNNENLNFDPSGISFVNKWNTGSFMINLDDIRIWNKLSDVPAYAKGYFASAKFDDGTDVDNATNVINESGSINIEFTEAMESVTAENFALKKRSSKSISDADYTGAEFTVESADENGVKISVNNFESDSSYRLEFNGLKTVSRTVLSDDFLVFTTSRNVNDRLSVVDYVAFDNGVKLPTTGVPNSFGDLIIHFAGEMNSETVPGAVSVTDSNGKTVEIIGDASSKSYTINSSSLALEPSTTYTIKVAAENLKLYNGAGVVNDYETSFTTSADLSKQEAIFEDGFEDGIGSWTGGGGTLVETAAYNGQKSVAVNITKSQNQNAPFVINGEIPENGVYEAWIYDDTVTAKSVLMSLTGTDNKGEAAEIRFGIKDSDYYIFTDSAASAPNTRIKRTVGWHRFVIDFTNPDETTAYIDDECVAKKNTTLRKAEKFGFLNFWRNNGSTILVDDVKIWNAMDYNVVSYTQIDKAFICDSEYNRIVDYTTGTECYIAVNVNNSTAAEKTAVLLVGEYENDKMTNVKLSEKVTIDGGRNVVLRVPYKIPDDFDNKTLKAFLWNDADMMVPLSVETNPKDITAVFLGGSITAGTGSSTKALCYASLVGEQIKQSYGTENVTIVNSGVGGKGSDYGVENFSVYVEQHTPDIVFIEYAVNDRNGEEVTVKKNVETLIRKCLAMPKVPNIVMVYTTTKEIDACARWHKEVADYYNIPSVDLQAYVKTNIVDGIFGGDWKTGAKFKEYMEDGVHPTDKLYEIYADEIIKYIVANGFTAPLHKEANFQ